MGPCAFLICTLISVWQEPGEYFYTVEQRDNLVESPAKSEKVIERGANCTAYFVFLLLPGARTKVRLSMYPKRLIVE
jgi:hypothetical protein